MVPNALVVWWLAVLATVNAAASLNEVFSWNELTFNWPNDDARRLAEQEGDYVAGNNLPLGIARWKDKLFVTVPRWKNGVAATLNYVSLHPINRTASLIPYPNWRANTIPKRDAKTEEDTLVSVFRVDVDSCDRLWVMDTGLADILGNPVQISQPAVVIFDLKTDQLIRRYPLKSTDVLQDSFFANIVVDSKSTRCDDSYAYLTDLGGYGLVVYSLKQNDSWRFKHNFFHFDPLHGDFNVNGVNFQWQDGVFGMGLGPENRNGYRTAYFHPLASLNEFSVNTAVLQNKTLAGDESNYFLFKVEGYKGKNTQASSAAFDTTTNVLFMSQLNRDGVACWNPKKPLKPANVGLIAQDHNKLMFVNDIKLDNDRNLWMISDRMPEFLYRSLNPASVNYRILRINVDEAIKNTVCQV